MEAIRASGIRFGIHPLGGAGVHYWAPIAERYKLNLVLVSDVVDPTFRFMTLDWDGKIRMDPSSKYAMQSLIALKDKFDVAMACDTDHDRHGIVTRSGGLMPANHYLATSIYYLFGHRPQWAAKVAVGKTAVSSSMIDRVTAGLSRELFEVPVGFKYFVDGLLEGKLGFVGEESAGASFLRRDGTVWTTDKDGIIAALLAAEMTATVKKDPGEIYHGLTQKYGDPFYDRTDAHATTQQKAMLAKMSKDSIQSPTLAGEKITDDPDPRPGRWPSHRRRKGDRRQRLVRGAAVGYRRDLQDLCRELPQPTTSGTDRRRSPDHSWPGTQLRDGREGVTCLRKCGSRHEKISVSISA